MVKVVFGQEQIQDAVRCSDDYNEYFVEEFDCFCEYLDDVEKVFPFLKNPAFEEEKSYQQQNIIGGGNVFRK